MHYGSINLTPIQQEAKKLAQSPARFILFRGGSRSGKSFIICLCVLLRALACPGSRHGIFRLTSVDVDRTLFSLTFRQVMEAHTPGLWDQLKRSHKIHGTNMTIELPNKSVIEFDGLDDTTRQDRILGREYTTVFINEVSQFRDFAIIQKLMSRLSENRPNRSGKVMQPKLFMDCNPTTKRHWTYLAFSEEGGRTRVNPISGEPWPRPDEWAQIMMNPVDNMENISGTYLEDLQNLSARDRKRFIEGEWQSDNDNAMFLPAWWEGDGKHARLKFGSIDRNDLKRVIVAVDPAGSSKPGSDETGIIVCGSDEEGHGYVLEDLSGRYQPHEWARVVIDAYEKWQADSVVTEDNFGKELVPAPIRMLDATVPIKTVNAVNGKVIRAGPVATLYEQGLIHHVGSFVELEGQMEDFHLDWNRTKDGSPDRLDALVWGMTELLVKPMQRRGGGNHRMNVW